ncbi:YbaB/EbfC family nucleoid-associated protein [Glycomyces sp. L485]|uniref:YbaB/EbfC family nucleoid-associated protein n=1 Tax=Glycomyces sp. L485 TaxID=2909235 RepID=UPI001F4BA41D|nr:YbaB/EbfC family nucleoid-associated protein [Glycomyces sp. L485]MCH7229383.1 YbaB/EbfC family nucleoid-associated protein [Glycomyces sp. L485]
MSDRNQRPDPEEMLAKLQQMQRDAEQTLQKYEDLRAEMGAEAVEAYSEDGLVRVRLDEDGRVAEIGIDEMAMRHRHALGGIIRSTIDEAVATHAMKMADMAQALVGDRIDVMGMVTRDMPEHLRDRARDNLDRD